MQNVVLEHDSPVNVTEFPAMTGSSVDVQDVPFRTSAKGAVVPPVPE
jgi:hypothetical protein